MADEQKGRGKWSPDDVKKHVAKIQEIVEGQKKKQKQKGENFTSVTPEEVEKKLRRVNSPMTVWQSWTSSTSPGGTITYSVGIYNPDPTQAIWTFVHVWVGSGNIDPVVGTYLSNVDARFPRLTEPDFAGLNIPSLGSASLTFTLAVPAAVEKSNYIGNSCLMQFNWHDVGTYYDRGVFVFKVA
ncbi:MAG TPA: hypothetical protein VFQ45_04315 [Longimicrobium sp.]|nr:hypothetical protein [Longimicrobium sp.]